MSRIPFGVLISIILILVSYFTSKMYALGFRFEIIASRVAFVTFLIVPILFVTSVVLARSGHIAASLYREIQLLAGIGFYLFIGAILLALCLIVAAIAGTQLPIGIAWGVLALSLIFAAVGYIQSTYITITPYTVTLSGAPASWEGRTAVLISDTHVGLVNHKTFSNTVVDKILEIKPDFVLHAGDFYDGPPVDTLPITASWKRLTQSIPVFFGPGNHEEYGNYGVLVDSIRAAGVTVLDDKKVEYDGVQITGITYRAGKDNPDAARALESLGITDQEPAILINHPPTALAAAVANHVDLQVSGHTHNGQFWPMTYLVRKIYDTYYYGLKDYETMKVITTSGVGTFGPPFRLFNTPELVLITFKSK